MTEPITDAELEFIKLVLTTTDWLPGENARALLAEVRRLREENRILIAGQQLDEEVIERFNRAWDTLQARVRELAADLEHAQTCYVEEFQRVRELEESCCTWKEAYDDSQKNVRELEEEKQRHQRQYDNMLTALHDKQVRTDQRVRELEGALGDIISCGNDHTMRAKARAALGKGKS